MPFRRFGYNEGFRRYKDQSELIGEQLQRDEEFRQKKQKERAEMNKMKQKVYYAGVGSRSTPDDILVLMEQLANRLREDGLTLRTGHAPGADQAFERGAGAQAQIFLPWASFEQDVAFTASQDPETGTVTEPLIHNEPSVDALAYAAKIHPAFPKLTPGAKKLHARNVHQILGPKLAMPTPVEFVLCWTQGGFVKGGTATAIRLALEERIPVYNLADEETYDMAFEWAWGD